MKGQCRRFAVGAGLALLFGLVPCTKDASAQGLPLRSPLVRGDVTGTVSWLNANKSDIAPDHYDDWYNKAAMAGGAVGWYWTNHLKTEIDAGISTRAEREVYSNSFDGRLQTSTESTFHFATRRIAIGQQYQFRDNAWFHPSVTAGVDLTWEKTDREDEAIFVFDTVTRQSQTLRQPVVQPTRTDLVTRPFMTFGLKSYVTQKTYVRTDMKFVFRHGVDEVLLRFGVGVDF